MPPKHPKDTRPLLVAAAIIWHEGRILLSERTATSQYAGQWEFPGGKVHAGETPQEALRRELQEELGIIAEIGTLYDLILHHEGDDAVLVLFYNCTRFSGVIQHIDVADHRWLYPHELASYPILPADAPLIERLQRDDNRS